MIVIKENVVVLRGIFLRGIFQIFNPNENLAYADSDSAPPKDVRLEISPMRGIILQKEYKKIKVWVRDEDKAKALERGIEGKSIKISTTMNAEYNRKMFEKLNLKGWEKVSNSLQTMFLPIIVSLEPKGFKSDAGAYRDEKIESDYNYFLEKSNQMPSKANLVERKNKNAFSSELHSSKMKKSSRLDRDLDFIFREDSRSGQVVDYFAQKKKQSQVDIKVNKNQSHYSLDSQLKAGKLMEQQKNMFKPEFYKNSLNSEENSKRFIEVIILSALAGFFLALGSNLKQLFL